MNENIEERGREQNSQDTPPTTPANLPALRERNGKWVKGRSGNPSGKPKGSVTAKTERMKNLMQHALADRLPEYLAALDFLRDNDPKAFAQEYRFLLEFFVPKLQRIDNTNLNVDAKETQIIEIGGTTFKIN